MHEARSDTFVTQGPNEGTAINTYFFLLRLFLFLFAGFFALKSPLLAPVIDQFCLLLAKLSGAILNIFDDSIYRDGDTLVRNSRRVAVQIDRSCSALTYFVGLAAAISASSITIRRKLALILAAFFLVQLLNLVRIASLPYLKLYLDDRWFDIVHRLAYPLYLSFILIVLAFAAWTARPWRSNSAVRR